MIDENVFKREWAVICDRLNRTPSRATAARYYQVLSRRMNTEQFVAAAEHVFATARYFPTPAEFLEAVEGETEERAAEDWSLCQRVMSGNLNALQRMSEAGRKTVALMGGPERLRMTAVDEVHFRRAEFMRLHGNAQEIHRREEGVSLPPMKPAARRMLAEAVPGLLGASEKD